MYTLDNVEPNAKAIKEYVLKCMKELKLGSIEVREYERQANMYDYNYLVTISKEYLEMMNNMQSQQECKVYYGV